MKKQLKIFRIMKTTLSILLIAMGASFCQGQEMDEARMERDLKVAQNILSTLSGYSNGDLNFTFFGSSSIEGNYVKGYGVMLNSPRRSSRTRYLTTTDGGVTLSGYTQSDDAKSYPIIIQDGQVQKAKKVDLDSLNKAQDEKWIGDMKTFLVDYSDLIGQLKPEDKIMVTSESSLRGGTWNTFELEMSGKSLSTSGSSVEITKKDVTAYKSGKISRAEALKRIKVIEPATKENVAQDVELLASIFQRLYKSDLSQTYYVSGRISYGKIAEFGIIFDMRVYSSSKEKSLHRITTQQRGGLTQEERDDIVKGMYPEFLDELKSNIIQYGRTVKSLPSDEIMMFKVRLTECKGCGIPKILELSIKASDLAAYDSGKINESVALEKISVKEIGEQ